MLVSICLENVQYIITTFAGTGTAGFNGDGAATAANLSTPYAVSMDNSGNLFISDASNNRIRKVNSAGILSTIAGTGAPGSAGGLNGDGSSATSAQMSYPQGISADISGNVYFADYNYCKIRKISSTGLITTIAGTGFAGSSVDGISGTSAQLGHAVAGVSADISGNVYIADASNNKVRLLNSAGIISTVVGTGTQGSTGDYGAATLALLYSPVAVAVDNSGNLYIAENGNHKVRKVIKSTGIITTYAGTGTQGSTGDGGPATLALLWSPSGIALDSSGNVYLSENGLSKIRMIAFSSGIIITIAGTGFPGSTGDGGSPTSAQLDFPYGMSLDTSGNLYVADYSNQKIRLIYQPAVGSTTDIITTVAGTGISGFYGDNGAAILAQLNSPYGGVSVDISGNVFIADIGNNRIRKVNTAGIITTIAGTGGAGSAGGTNGDGGPATSAQLYWPLGVSADISGNVYISDSNNNRIRKVNSAGIVSTIAGTGGAGSAGGTNGDGGPATSAALNNPSGLSVDTSGNVYIPEGYQKIRKVSSSGIITTFAGTGQNGSNGDGGAATLAQLSGPRYVSADTSGNVYIADSFNNKIRKVSSGIITTFAGTGTAGSSVDGISATLAQLNDPAGVTVDSSGNVFIAEWGNNKIRMVSIRSGIIITIAGTGTMGSSGDYGAANLALLSDPSGLSTDTSGNLYFADYGNNKIRFITVPPQPSAMPTAMPTAMPSIKPTQPSSQPSQQPTQQPSSRPTRPSSQPSMQPSAQPSRQPTMQPSSQPSQQPTRQPSSRPTRQPSSQPSSQPNAQPSRQPTMQPSSQPSRQPTQQPSSRPTQPSSQPTRQPSSQPSSQPTQQPTRQPTMRPSSQPSQQPTWRPRQVNEWGVCCIH